MSDLLLLIFYCALLGSGVGFLAGLLGIGKGTNVLCLFDVNNTAAL